MNAAFASRGNPKIDVSAFTHSFEDSRRLVGPNRHFADCGAVLETLVDAPLSAATVQAWRDDVARVCVRLQLPSAITDARLTPRGASLAMSAPIDQLFTATEINEWAWQRASGSNDGFHAPGHAALCDEVSAIETLRRHAAGERHPALRALSLAVHRHGLCLYADDDVVSIGEGSGSQSGLIAALPGPDDVPWSELHSIPKALVTGSNGKTTSVRLLATMSRAQGWRTGHTCTDGLFVDGRLVESGDFSGPAGARAILRRSDVDAAILEAARGGMLRRGLALSRADVALVTNVSVEHFGEYGIYDLDALADVKLSLARTIDDRGMLVLNADDATLLRKSAELTCPLAWFAQEDRHPKLVAHRALGGATCALRDGNLVISAQGQEHDLGRIEAMPLSMGGRAGYNVANLAGAALSGFFLGVAPELIAQVLSQFGSRREDNPGRLQLWNLGGVRVLVDYAHNPEGLDGFLRIATHERGHARLGLLLGQAGNREDEDIRALADVAASFHPQYVVLKDIAGYMRGRQAGEVAGILRAQLLATGMSAVHLHTILDEAAAARHLLAWAQPGDIIALPLHGTRARAAVIDWLEELERSHWHPGTALPANLHSASPFA
jgi:cyanophycin synthetase